MLYDYLDEFTVIARTGSLSKASHELGVSQPALGRHLCALEAYFGTPLVTKGAHGVTPTAQGRYLLGMALDIRSIGEEIERHFDSLRHGRAARQLYIVGFASMDAVLGAIKQACDSAAGRGFQMEMPLYRFDVDARDVCGALTSCGADIVITLEAALDGLDPSAGVYCRRLYDAGCLAVVEPDSHLAARDSICLKELAGTRIARPSGAIEYSDLQWEELRRRCLEQGFSPLSYTTSFDARPYNGWSLPGCVVLFREGQIGEDAAKRIGKAALRVEDFTYRVVAACRSDDELARFVVDEAAACLAPCCC